MGRDRFLKQSLGGSFYRRTRESRILVVGAGGIGCELLKNLVCSGFGEIHVVDLDTIDLSNLNRQFLFRQSHIKKSKALVAKDTAGKFNPHVTIEAHHANIKDPQFNVDWFRSFVIVFNALDNLDARRHVNRMCLAADVPLVESGTTGFKGQVQPIVKGRTACYDCTPKQTPVSFPVCTIRSTPSQPIHCIVWAKSYLFNELFGISEDAAPDLDHTEDSDNAQEIEELKKEAAALKAIRMSMGSDEFPRKVFEKVYTDDIDRLRGMEDMWKTRKPPTALNFDQISQGAADVDPAFVKDDQRNWTIQENFAVFCDSLQRLSSRLEQLKTAQGQDTSNAPPILTFDKDDKDTLDFVAAAANLRSLIFGIPTKSEFDIKQMAGNIIPAIATTNATTAALCVLQAYKILNGQLDKAKMVFLTKSIDRVIIAEDLSPPRPGCAVCGNASARLIVNPERVTLGQLVEMLLHKKLGYDSELSITTDAGIIYDPEEVDNLPKSLAELGVLKDTFITVRDESDDEPRINLVLSISTSEATELVSPFTLMPDTLVVPKKADATNGVTAADGEVQIPEHPAKRKRNADEAELDIEQVSKRGKVAEENPNTNGDAIVIEDEGAITID